jgi:uncharacterized protein YegP (UPF0339 family)
MKGAEKTNPLIGGHAMATRTFPSYWLYRDVQKKWRWTYHAENGLAIAVSSESYERRAGAQRGIDILKASYNSQVWLPNEDADAS